MVELVAMTEDQELANACEFIKGDFVVEFCCIFMQKERTSEMALHPQQNIRSTCDSI